MRARCLVFICLLTGFVTNPATGQREWAFGGPDGDDWAEITELNALADATSVPGVLQSLELRPDVNITPVIYGTNHYELWQNPPNPLWELGIPRFYRGSGNYGPKTPGPTTTVMVDGDLTTFWSQENFGPGGCKMSQEFHTLALGGPLPLQRFVLSMPPDEIVNLFGRPFWQYVPRNGELSAGWHGVEGQIAQEQHLDLTGGGCCGQDSYAPFTDILGNVQDNIDAPLTFEFPTTYYSHLRWVTFADQQSGGADRHAGCPVSKRIGYADLELYGDGFAGESFLRTQVLDLGEPGILGDVDLEISRWRREPGRWERILDDSGEVVKRNWIPGTLIEHPEVDAEVSVRIKTGTTDSPRQYFTYTDFGELEPTTEAAWTNMNDSALLSCHGKCGTIILKREPDWRGPVVQDRDNWTPWSGPIRDETMRLALPKGQWFQVLVNMRSSDPAHVARLESVSIEVLPLLVPRLVGEVAIALDGSEATLTEVPLGEPTDLTYAIRADFEGRSSAGFDAIRIATPSRPEFLSLMRGEPLEEKKIDDDAIKVDNDGLTIFLPEPVEGSEEIRVGLRTTLFRVSEKLLGEVFATDNSKVRQVIDEGNATDELTTDQLQVVSVDELPDAISGLVVEPRTFTPNGDGSNDELRISYILFGVIDTQVEIGIYTLDGRLVRTVEVEPQSAGPATAEPWDGRDESGELLAPGLYLCQVETDASRGRFAEMTPISLAY